MTSLYGSAPRGTVKGTIFCWPLIWCFEGDGDAADGEGLRNGGRQGRERFVSLCVCVYVCIWGGWGANSPVSWKWRIRPWNRMANVLIGNRGANHRRQYSQWMRVWCKKVFIPPALFAILSPQTSVCFIRCYVRSTQSDAWLWRGSETMHGFLNIIQIIRKSVLIFSITPLNKIQCKQRD